MNPFGLLVVAIGVMLLIGGWKSHSVAKKQSSRGGGVPGNVTRTAPLNPNTPYTSGMPSYPAPVPTGDNVTGPYQSQLPGAGTTGGQGL